MEPRVGAIARHVVFFRFHRISVFVSKEKCDWNEKLEVFMGLLSGALGQVCWKLPPKPLAVR